MGNGIDDHRDIRGVDIVVLRMQGGVRRACVRDARLGVCRVCCED